ncbi:MAG: prepilin peptidase [Tuberibacillus sp.]
MIAASSVFIFLLGAVMGSFFNVVGLRVPKHQSIIFPPSHCPQCRKRLTAGDLIPILSYLLVRGKCRYCRTPIPIIYPFVELSTACLFTFASLHSGLRLNIFVTWALISLLVITFVSDIRYKLIPDKTLLFFTALFIALQIFSPYQSWLNGFLGASFVFIVLLAIAAASGGKMGGGDIKLFGVLGFVLGTKGVMLALSLSCIYGSLFGTLGLIFGKLKWGRPLPFAPYIALGALTSWFYGDELWRWYGALL